MFERFTESARHVVVVSQDVARELQQAEIGAAHFLVALRQEPDPRLTEVWIGIDPPSGEGGTQAKLTVPGLRAVTGTGPGSDADRLPFSGSGKSVFENTLRAGLALGTAPPVSTIELLLGVLDTPDDDVGGLLAAARIEHSVLRARAAAAAVEGS